MRLLRTAPVLFTALAVLASAAPATGSELPVPLPAGRLAYSTAVYESNEQQSSIAVHGLGTMSLDGTDQRTLTSPERPEHDHSPDWSPDGRWLVAMRSLNRPDSPTSTEIRITSADGSQEHVVGYGTFPVWSPDGRTVAWSSKDPARPGLVLLPVDITGEALVTDPAGIREIPTPRRALASAWNPLGGSLAVWVDQEAGNYQLDLWHADVTTGQLRQLAPGLHQYAHSVRPAWHPTGLQLAVIAREDGTESPTETWLVAADGSSHARLLPEPDPAGHIWVSWAPNGLSLAVEVGYDVLLVTVGGVVLRSLDTERLDRAETPVWSPDGTHVYVVANERGGEWKPELWALPVVGEDLRQLTTDSSVFPTTATAVDPGLALRIIGTSPADTAAAVADRLPDSDTVVLTTAASAPAATPLATALEAPLLETFADSLPEATRRELEDRRPTTAWLVGQVSDAVEVELRALGITTINRVGGTDEPAVAAGVAEHVPATTAFLAPADGELEQAAAAAVAGARSEPLLLTGSDALGPSTRAALQNLGITSVVLTTASSAVSTSVDDELRSLGIDVQRLSGSSPSDAALALADAFEGSSSMDRPVVVPEDSPDIAGPVLAASRGTVLLPAGTEASDPVVRFVDERSDAIASLELMSSAAELTPVLETALERAVQGRADLTEPEQPTAPGARGIDAACPRDRVPPNPFDDVVTGSTHERAISCLVWWKVASGRTSTSYAPVDGVTRDAMAAFVARTILKAQPGSLPDSPPDAFGDDDSSVHHHSINQLAAVGIIGGTGNGSYTPGRVVTRGQMAKFLASAAEHVLGSPLPADRDYFGDDSSSPFEADINRVAQAGLTGGRAAGTYDAGGSVQRDQMGSFLARTLDLFVAEGAALPQD